MKQPVKALFNSDKSQLINEGKKIYNTKKMKLLLSDNQQGIYDALVVDNALLDRITIGATNISQLPYKSEEIIPVYAFFQKYSKHIMDLIKDTNIQNIDVSKENWKDNFLNECNAKLFNPSVIKYVKYAMYEFYTINPGMKQFKWPFIEIANAAGITYFLNKYGIDKTLLNKTDEERKQRWETRMKNGRIVFLADENSDPKEIAERVIKHINNRKMYENPN